MSQPLPNPLWQAYPLAFRRDAHQLLAWGYQNALPNIHCDCEEPEIDSYIADAIDDILNDPKTHKRFNRYSLKVQHPAKGEGRVGKKRRKLDLVIHEHTGRPRANYVFESKILKHSNHPMKIYVGNDGMRRFIKGTAYATDSPEAAMVAYIQNRQIHDWKLELDTAISPIQLKASNIVKELKDSWFSRHQRDDGTMIEIHHIFLDCTTSPPE